jgi:hypothetical protein
LFFPPPAWVKKRKEKLKTRSVLKNNEKAAASAAAMAARFEKRLWKILPGNPGRATNCRM